MNTLQKLKQDIEDNNHSAKSLDFELSKRLEMDAIKLSELKEYLSKEPNNRDKIVGRIDSLKADFSIVLAMFERISPLIDNFHLLLGRLSEFQDAELDIYIHSRREDATTFEQRCLRSRTQAERVIKGLENIKQKYLSRGNP